MGWPIINIDTLRDLWERGRKSKDIDQFLTEQGLNPRLAKSFKESMNEADRLGNNDGKPNLDEFITLEDKFDNAQLSKTFDYIKGNWNRFHTSRPSNEVSKEIRNSNPSSPVSPNSQLFNKEQVLNKINNSTKFTQTEKNALNKLYTEYFENIEGEDVNPNQVTEQEIINTLIGFKALPEEILFSRYQEMQKELKSVDIEALDSLDGEKYNSIIYDLNEIKALSFEGPHGSEGHNFFINQELADSNNLRYDDVFSISRNIPGVDSKFREQTGFFQTANAIASGIDENGKLIVNFSYSAQGVDVFDAKDEKNTLKLFNEKYGTQLTSFNPNEISEEDREKIKERAFRTNYRISNEVQAIEKLANNPNVSKVNIAARNNYDKDLDQVNITALIIGNHDKVNIIGGHLEVKTPWEKNFRGYEETKLVSTSTQRPNLSTPLAGNSLESIKVTDKELSEIIEKTKEIKGKIFTSDPSISLEQINKDMEKEFKQLIGNKVFTVEQTRKFLDEVFNDRGLTDALNFSVESLNEDQYKSKDEEIYIHIPSIETRQIKNNLYSLTNHYYYVGKDGILTGKMRGTSNATPKG